MSPISGSSKESATARLLGSGTSGILELLGFHPVDTIAKRLMNNKKPVLGFGFQHAKSTLNSVIFKDSAKLGTIRKYLSLFPGLGVAAGYKILQRMYKFAGQMHVKDYLQSNYSQTFNTLVGEKHSKTMMSAIAGSLIGIGEVVLLPLDSLKIKLQVASKDLKNKSVWQIVKEEKLGLYRGAGWTMARNAPGSFALFGGSAATKQYIFKLEDSQRPSFFQETCCSVVGAITSICVSAPLDVIKTRIQAKSIANAEGGATILRKMIVQEGLGALFKGLTPKILVVGPKLIFSFTIAKQLIPFFATITDKQ